MPGIGSNESKNVVRNELKDFFDPRLNKLKEYLSTLSAPKMEVEENQNIIREAQEINVNDEQILKNKKNRVEAEIKKINAEMELLFKVIDSINPNGYFDPNLVHRPLKDESYNTGEDKVETPNDFDTMNFRLRLTNLGNFLNGYKVDVKKLKVKDLFPESEDDLEDFLKNYPVDVRELPALDLIIESNEVAQIKDLVFNFETGRGNDQYGCYNDITENNNEFYSALIKIKDLQTRRKLVNEVTFNLNTIMNVDFSLREKALVSMLEKKAGVEVEAATVDAVILARKYVLSGVDRQVQTVCAKIDAIRHHESGKENYEKYLDADHLQNNALYQQLKLFPNINHSVISDLIIQSGEQDIQSFDDIKQDLFAYLGGLKRELDNKRDPAANSIDMKKVEANIQSAFNAADITPLEDSAAHFLAIITDCRHHDAYDEIVSGKSLFFNALTNGLYAKDDTQEKINDAKKQLAAVFDSIRKDTRINDPNADFASEYKTITAFLSAFADKHNQINKNAVNDEFLRLLCQNNNEFNIVKRSSMLLGKEYGEIISLSREGDNPLLSLVSTLDPEENADDLFQTLTADAVHFDNLYRNVWTFAKNHNLTFENPQDYEDLQTALSKAWELYPAANKNAREAYNFDILKVAEANLPQVHQQAELLRWEEEPVIEEPQNNVQPQVQGNVEQVQAENVQDKPQAQADNAQNKPQVQAGNVQDKPQAQAGNVQNKPQEQKENAQQQAQAAQPNAKKAEPEYIAVEVPEEEININDYVINNVPEKFEEHLLLLVSNARRFSGDSRSHEEIESDIIHGRDAMYNSLYAASVDQEGVPKQDIRNKIKENLAVNSNNFREFYNEVDTISSVCETSYSIGFNNVSRVHNSLFAASITDDLGSKVVGSYSDGKIDDPEFVNCSNELKQSDLGNIYEGIFTKEELATIVEAQFISTIGQTMNWYLDKNVREYGSDEQQNIRASLKDRVSLEARSEQKSNVPTDLFEQYLTGIASGDKSRSSNMLRMIVPQVRRQVIADSANANNHNVDYNLLISVSKCCQYISKKKEFDGSVMAAAKFVHDALPIIDKRCLSYDINEYLSGDRYNYAKYVSGLYESMKEIHEYEKLLSDKLMDSYLSGEQNANNDQIKDITNNIYARKYHVDSHLDGYNLLSFRLAEQNAEGVGNRDFEFDSRMGIRFNQHDFISVNNRNAYLERVKGRNYGSVYIDSNNHAQPSDGSVYAAAYYTSTNKKIDFEEKNAFVINKEIRKDLRDLSSQFHKVFDPLKANVSMVQTFLRGVDRDFNMLLSFDLEGLDHMIRSLNGAKNLIESEEGGTYFNAALHDYLDSNASDVLNKMEKNKNQGSVFEIAGNTGSTQAFSNQRTYTNIRDNIRLEIIPKMKDILEKAALIRPLFVDNNEIQNIAIQNFNNPDYNKAFEYNQIKAAFSRQPQAAANISPSLNVVNSSELILNANARREYLDSVGRVSYDHVKKAFELNKKTLTQKVEQKEDPNIEPFVNFESLENRLEGLSESFNRYISDNNNPVSEPVKDLMKSAALVCRKYSDILAANKGNKDSLAGEKQIAASLFEQGKPSFDYAVLNYAIDVYTGQQQPGATLGNIMLKANLEANEKVKNNKTADNCYLAIRSRIGQSTYLFDSSRLSAEKSKLLEKYKRIEFNISTYGDLWSEPLKNTANTLMRKVMSTHNTFMNYSDMHFTNALHDGFRGVLANKVYEPAVNLFILDKIFTNSDELKKLDAQALNTVIDGYWQEGFDKCREFFDGKSKKDDVAAFELMTSLVPDFSPAKEKTYDEAFADKMYRFNTREVPNSITRITANAEELGIRSANANRPAEPVSVKEDVEQEIKNLINQNDAIEQNQKEAQYERIIRDGAQSCNPVILAEINKRRQSIENAQKELNDDRVTMQKVLDKLEQNLYMYESDALVNGVDGVSLKDIKRLVSMEKSNLTNEVDENGNYKRSEDFIRISKAASKYLNGKESILDAFKSFDQMTESFKQKKEMISIREKALAQYSLEAIEGFDVPNSENYINSLNQAGPQLDNFAKDNLESVCKNLYSMKNALGYYVKNYPDSAMGILANEGLNAIKAIDESLRKNGNISDVLFDKETHLPTDAMAALKICSNVFVPSAGKITRFDKDSQYGDILSGIDAQDINKDIEFKIQYDAKKEAEKEDFYKQEAKQAKKVSVFAVLESVKMDIRQGQVSLDDLKSDALTDRYNEIFYDDVMFPSFYAPVIANRIIEPNVAVGDGIMGFQDYQHSTQLQEHIDDIASAANKIKDQSVVFAAFVEDLKNLRADTNALYVNDHKEALLNKNDLGQYLAALSGYAEKVKAIKNAKGLTKDEKNFISKNADDISLYIRQDINLIENLSGFVGNEGIPLRSMINANNGSLFLVNNRRALERNFKVHESLQLGSILNDFNTINSSGHVNSSLYNEMINAANKLKNDIDTHKSNNVLLQSHNALVEACNDYISSRENPSSEMGQKRLSYAFALSQAANLNKQAVEIQIASINLANKILQNSGIANVNDNLRNKILESDLFRRMVNGKTAKEIQAAANNANVTNTLVTSAMRAMNVAAMQPAEDFEEPDLVQAMDEDERNVEAESILKNVIDSDVNNQFGDRNENYYHSTQLKLHLGEMISGIRNIEKAGSEFSSLADVLDGISQATDRLYEVNGKTAVLSSKDLKTYNNLLNGALSRIRTLSSSSKLSDREKEFLPKMKDLENYIEQDQLLIGKLSDNLGDETNTIFAMIGDYQDAMQRGDVADIGPNTFDISQVLEGDGQTYLTEKINGIKQAFNLQNVFNFDIMPDLPIKNCLIALDDLNKESVKMHELGAANNNERVEVNEQTLNAYIQKYKTASRSIKQFLDRRPHENGADGILNEIKDKIDNESRALGRIKLGQDTEPSLPSMFSKIKETGLEIDRFKAVKEGLVAADYALHRDTSLYKSMDASLNKIITDLESGRNNSVIMADYDRLIITAGNYVKERGKSVPSSQLGKERLRLAKQLKVVAEESKEKLELKIEKRNLAVKLLADSGNAVLAGGQVNMNDETNLKSIDRLIKSKMLLDITYRKTAAQIRAIAGNETLRKNLVIKYRGNAQVNANPENAQVQPAAAQNQNVAGQVQQNVAQNQNNQQVQQNEQNQHAEVQNQENQQIIGH